MCPYKVPYFLEFFQQVYYKFQSVITRGYNSRGEQLISYHLRTSMRTALLVDSAWTNVKSALDHHKST